MANGIKVYVLNVGQGMGNYIEVYGKGLDKPPTKAFIYDLGSEKGYSTYRPVVINFIVNRLKAMAKPRLDLIVFSHGDKDHWNLFRALITECDTQIPKLTYGDVFFGGEESQYNFGSSNYNVLQGLVNRKATVKGQFADAASDFYCTPPSEMADLDGLKVRLLLANIDEGMTLKDVDSYSSFTNKNSVSAVLVCEYAGKRFIFTGDATGLTVKKIDDLIVKYKLSAQVNNTFMLLVPHHGSAVTLKYGSERYGPAEKFAAYCDANSIAASADFRVGFNHPDYDILEIFCNKTMKAVLAPLAIGKGGYTPPAKEKYYPNHLYVAYNGSDWNTFYTKQNIYTTIYSTSKVVDTWIFSVTETGVVSTERVPGSTPLCATQSSLVNRNASVGDGAGLPVNTTEFSPVYKALRKKRAPGSNVGMFPYR